MIMHSYDEIIERKGYLESLINEVNIKNVRNKITLNDFNKLDSLLHYNPYYLLLINNIYLSERQDIIENIKNIFDEIETNINDNITEYIDSSNNDSCNEYDNESDNGSDNGSDNKFNKFKLEGLIEQYEIGCVDNNLMILIFRICQLMASNYIIAEHKDIKIDEIEISLGLKLVECSIAHSSHDYKISDLQSEIASTHSLCVNIVIHLDVDIDKTNTQNNELLALNMIKHYEIELNKNKENINAIIKLANYYEKQKKYDIMMKYYIMITDIDMSLIDINDMNDMNDINNLCYCYDKIECYKQYTESNNFHEIYQTIDVVDYYLGKIDVELHYVYRLQSLFDKFHNYCEVAKTKSNIIIQKYMIYINKTDCNYYTYGLAVFYAKIKNYTQFEKYCLLILDKKQICFNEIAQVCFDDTNYQKALTYFTMHIEYANDISKYDDADLIYKIGYCNYKLENYNEMIKSFTKCINHEFYRSRHEFAFDALFNYYKEKGTFNEYAQFINENIFKSNIKCRDELISIILPNPVSAKKYIQYIKSKNNISYDNTCSICIDSTENDKIVLSCKHTFCGICLIHLIENKRYKCELCKNWIC